MSKDKFFVGIKNPINTRRLLLNSSKDILDALKDFESFESLKMEKAKYVVELKKVLDEITVLNRKLKSHLPKTPLQAPPKYERVARKRKGKKVPKTKMREVASKMDLLESELAKVEDRLQGLE
ncbi:hypothetical protein KY338_02800 [Candidatus Woesearchaeota archaeon]|nr:hypothetical protein [Candidatus Woesearchaeota archaeon]MBW3005713.1 hypothetical protein [Candidatus Woesearchaeota archaeon]